jgi:GNAT superfamily N-acetyltransferase
MAPRDLAAELARTVAAIYGDAEQRLLKALSLQVAQDIKAEHVDLLAAYRAIQERTARVLARLEQDASGTATKAVLEAWATGASTAVDELNRLGGQQRLGWLARRSAIVRALSRLLGFTRRRETIQAAEVAELRAALPGIDAIMVLAGELTQRMSSTHLRVLRWQEDAYRAAVTNPAVSMLTGAKSRLQATQTMWDDLTAQGITGFVDRKGRNWDLASYAEMATRTAASHAQIEGHLDQLKRQGHVLAQVTDSPEECERCRPWEGKVLAIVGPAGPRQIEHAIEDGLMVTVDVYATFDEAVLAGLHHPNCTHREQAYLPGVTPTPQDTENEQGYDDRQELRRLERKVRRAKRREAAALTPEAREQWAAKVRNAQREVREHVKKTTAVRRPDREQLAPDAPDPIVGPVRPPRPTPPPRRKVQPPIDGLADLPAPREPAPPAPSGRPLARDLVPSTDAEAVARRPKLFETFTAMFAGRVFGGLTVEVTEVLGAKGYLYYGGSILADGEPIGDFERTLRLDRDGTLFASHDLLEIEPDYQGQGFASQFNALLYEWYRESGLDCVKVHANIDVGGYTWARAGFDFEGPDDAERIGERIRRAMRPDDGEAVLAAAEALLDRLETTEFGSDDYPTAYEMSQLGRSPGDTSWLGKRAMLGSDWYGVREP